MTASVPSFGEPPELWPRLAGRPPPMSEDPFSLPPAGWERTAPGTPLRRRRVQIALFGLVPVRLEAWQLLYRSTDHNGAPETTVTTVLVPANATEQSPVVAYQVAIDAVTSRAFPSYGLLRGSFGPNQLQNELALMVAALGEGWILTVSDHEGPHGLVMVAIQPGYHVLDGIRATLAIAGTVGMPAVPARAPVGIWGYSGGGTASTWAAELAPVHAPELNIVGALLGAPAALPGPLVGQHSGGAFSGLLVPIFAALIRAHPQVRASLQRHLSPEGLAMVAKSAEVGLVESVLRWPFTNFDKFTDQPLGELMAEPELAEIIEGMRLGGQAPRCPVYLYHSVHDQLLPIAGSDQLAERYVAGGTHVTYRRDRLSEHTLLAVNGTPAAIDWLAQRFAGTPLPPGPDIATVISTAATGRALRGFVRWLLASWRLVCGRL